MKRSLWTETAVRASVPVATRNATGTVTGASVDRHERLADFNSAMLLVLTGTITDGTHTVRMQHSDDEATWEDVPARIVVGDSLPIELTASSDTRVYHCGIAPIRRYLRAVVEVTVPSLGSGGTYGAFIQLGYPRRPPVDHSIPA